MRLYDKEGWLDIPHIAEICDKNNINFIIIIGKRQVGKTYGVLKYMLDFDKRFVFIRTTKTEMDMLKGGANSPFEKIYDNNYNERVQFKGDSEYTARITLECFNSDENEPYVKDIALGVSLSVIGRIRGFNGDIYTDAVFDEFIPESKKLQLKNAGNLFLGMHETINGNRELEGRPCLRHWLLANSNDLDNDILTKLKLTKIVERMSIKGSEYYMDSKRGFLILMPDSKQVVEKRKKGGLFRMIGTDSDYAKMSLGNEFAFNDYTDVATKPIKEYNPFVTIGDITIHLHKNDKTIYVTDKVKAKARYTFTDSETHLNKFNRDFSDFRSAYLSGRMIFNNMNVKIKFLNYIGL